MLPVNPPAPNDKVMSWSGVIVTGLLVGVGLMTLVVVTPKPASEALQQHVPVVTWFVLGILIVFDLTRWSLGKYSLFKAFAGFLLRVFVGLLYGALVVAVLDQQGVHIEKPLVYFVIMCLGLFGSLACWPVQRPNPNAWSIRKAWNGSALRQRVMGYAARFQGGMGANNRTPPPP